MSALPTLGGTFSEPLSVQNSFLCTNEGKQSCLDLKKVNFHLKCKHYQYYLIICGLCFMYVLCFCACSNEKWPLTDFSFCLATFNFPTFRHILIVQQNDSLPSYWIHCYTNRLACFLWFSCRGNQGLSVVLTSIHTNNLCIFNVRIL